MATKVLISGDVDGKFDAVFKRVAALNKSNAGPFDVLLCVGRFFAPAATPGEPPTYIYSLYALALRLFPY
jgi:hypothetical protein